MASMAARAEQEKELLGEPEALAEPKWNKARKKSALSGRGFGGAQTKLTPEKKLEALRMKALEEEGVVYIKGGLTKETTAALRECVLEEIEEVRRRQRTRELQATTSGPPTNRPTNRPIEHHDTNITPLSLATQARSAVRADPSVSRSRFHVPVEQVWRYDCETLRHKHEP